MRKTYVALFVDDDAVDRKLFEMAVKGMHTPVQCKLAAGSAEALELLSLNPHFNPDFIFIDVYMPGMDGIELLREIKKIARLQEVPVYMYSAAGGKQITKTCIALGATGVIQKANNVSELKGEIYNVLFAISSGLENGQHLLRHYRKTHVTPPDKKL